MHLRNPHHFRYNFPTLVDVLPELKEYVFTNIHGSETIDFHNPDAVKRLNQALLKHHYNIDHWDIPSGYLCPAIPGRADYLHHIADLIADKKGCLPKGDNISVLDIGVGANCIYPLIGHRTFGWSFVGSEVNPIAYSNANKIIEENNLSSVIQIRQQNSANNILKDIIAENEVFDLIICNPPFHASKKEAQAATERKSKNLKQKLIKKNFGGQAIELWYDGGELAFLNKLIHESTAYQNQVHYFTSLVSKEANVPQLIAQLRRLEVSENKIIEMSLGNKKSRILVWSFLKEKQRKIWKEARWFPKI